MSFKPCYKWNTFNTGANDKKHAKRIVLNLVISGIPSILDRVEYGALFFLSFKPCYKWNTFNTYGKIEYGRSINVLNLVISGIPSILKNNIYEYGMDTMF